MSSLFKLTEKKRLIQNYLTISITHVYGPENDVITELFRATTKI